MRKYKCINEMMIEVVDGDGAIIDNEYNFIEKGSVWELDDSDFRVCDGEVNINIFNCKYNNNNFTVDYMCKDIKKT